MKKIHDFVILIGGGRISKRYITEEHAYSKQSAIKCAQELSMLYPSSEVFVEHWILVHSNNFIKGGFYKGKVFHVTQEKAA
mgnify:FL=1